MQGDGAVFKAHGVILAARSEPFSRMLAENPNMLSLGQYSGAVINHILKFIYSGKIDMSSLDPRDVDNLHKEHTVNLKTYRHRSTFSIL